MKAFLPVVASLCCVLAMAMAGVVVANSAVQGDDPAMMVSPATIVTAKVDTVTVHTNIPAATVEPGSLALDGVAPTAVGVDDCGDIVGKFAVADLGLEPGEATLTLTGAYTEAAGGGDFAATCTVRVK